MFTLGVPSTRALATPAASFFSNATGCSVRRTTVIIRPTGTGNPRRRVSAKGASFQPNGVGKVEFKSSNSSRASSPAFVKRALDLQSKIRALGVPAVISYGLLNTLYYVIAFLVAYWSYTTVAGGAPPQGLRAQYGQALLVLSVVWAGSQVTKLLRMSAALALSPACARLLRKVQSALRLKSQGQAAAIVTALCFLLALTVFSASVVIKSLPV